MSWCPSRAASLALYPAHEDDGAPGMGSNPEEEGDKPDISEDYKYVIFVVESASDIALAIRRREIFCRDNNAVADKKLFEFQI